MNGREGREGRSVEKGTEKVVEMERVSRKFMSKCLVSRKLIVDSSYVCGRFVWFHGGHGFSSNTYNVKRGFSRYVRKTRIPTIYSPT